MAFELLRIAPNDLKMMHVSFNGYLFDFNEPLTCLMCLRKYIRRC